MDTMQEERICPCAHDPATIERELEQVAALYRVFGDKTRFCTRSWSGKSASTSWLPSCL